MDENLDNLLNFDSLAEAEKITGKSYKTDRSTESLGFFLHLMNGEKTSFI